MAFEDVRVPATNLIGGEGDGMSFVYEWFRFERLMVGARCLGAAERLVDEMHGVRRAARGSAASALADKQLVQGMLADSLTELFAARSMVYEVARSLDAGVDRKVAHAQCSMVKLYASARWPAASPTGPCRSSAAAATCARTSPSGSSASCASSGSGRAPARSSASIIADQLGKRGRAATRLAHGAARAVVGWAA